MIIFSLACYITEERRNYIHWQLDSTVIIIDTLQHYYTLFIAINFQTND